MHSGSEPIEPFVLCIDVGSYKNIGWAGSDGQTGGYRELGDAMAGISDRLSAGKMVALGFEAPVWTPARGEITKLTSRRGGFETKVNKPWSAGAGAAVTTTNLALMQWCFRQIAKRCPAANATVRLDRFGSEYPLLIWEAFVTGTAKGSSHSADAMLGCEDFVRRWPNVVSDIPAEPCINHAVSAAMVAGLKIDPGELSVPVVVVGV